MHIKAIPTQPPAWIDKSPLPSLVFPLFQRGNKGGFFLCCCLSMFLTACTTAGDAIPQGGPTMAQVYEDAMQRSNGENLDQVRADINSPITLNSTNTLSSYTRSINNEINNLFPTLPNPQLTMYVYPHLAGQDEAPIPGYSTAFPLFEKMHYALPGETSVI